MSMGKVSVYMQSSRGFSLIELLLVVVVIGLIAALAIPNMLAARRAANEGSSVSALRTLYVANISYAATTGAGSYSGLAGTVGISSLDDLAVAGLIDVVLGSGEKTGYLYVGNRLVSTSSEPETFYFSSNPATVSGILMTGAKRYGVAIDGVIKSDADAGDLAVPFDEVTLLAASPLQN